MKNKLKAFALIIIMMLSISLTSCSYDSTRPQTCVHEFVNNSCIHCRMENSLYALAPFKSTSDPGAIVISSNIVPNVYTRDGLYGKIIIPSTLAGKTVIALDYWSFINNDRITEVVLPDTINTIGRAAFKDCDMLHSVTIGAGIRIIEKNAFADCPALSDVYVKDISAWLNITFCNEYCSYLNESSTLHFLDENGTEITDLTIPEGISIIPEYAFRNAKNIVSVTIPRGVDRIEKDAFAGCDSLTSVTLGENVTDIADDAFAGCNGLYVVDNKSSLVITAGSEAYGGIARCAKLIIDDRDDVSVNIGYAYTLENDFLFRQADGVYQLIAYVGNEENIVFPKSVNGSSYEICSPLGVKRVTIPDTLTKINDDAFAGCESLISVSLSAGVEYIGAGAFRDCKNLASVNLGSGIKDIGSYAFYGCDSLVEVSADSKMNSIGSYAFYGCESLEAFRLGKGVDVIEDFAFFGCKNLSVVNINSIYKSIGNYAFAYSKIADLSFSPDLSQIGDGAFFECDNIVSAEIPATVEKIGYGIFSFCDNMTSLYVHKNNEKYYSEGNCIVEKSTKTLVLGTSSSVIPNGVLTIGKNAFLGCNKLNNVTIPDSVTTIESSAFEGCASLSEIVIGDNVKRVGDWAFANCTGLKKVTVSIFTKEIGEFAFSGCTKLCELDLRGNYSWKVTRSDGIIILSSDELSDPAKAAKYITSTYSSYTWTNTLIITSLK